MSIWDADEVVVETEVEIEIEVEVETEDEEKNENENERARRFCDEEEEAFFSEVQQTTRASGEEASANWKPGRSE